MKTKMINFNCRNKSISKLPTKTVSPFVSMGCSMAQVNILLAYVSTFIFFYLCRRTFHFYTSNLFILILIFFVKATVNCNITVKQPFQILTDLIYINRLTIDKKVLSSTKKSLNKKNLMFGHLVKFWEVSEAKNFSSTLL